MVALKMVPVDAVAKALVLPLQVEPVEVGVVAGRVPPGPGKPDSAIVAPCIVILVDCAELGPSGRKTPTQIRAETVVENAVCSEGVCEPELIDK